MPDYTKHYEKKMQQTVQPDILPIVHLQEIFLDEPDKPSRTIPSAYHDTYYPEGCDTEGCPRNKETLNGKP